MPLRKGQYAPHEVAAFDDGYGFAAEMRDKYGYGVASIRDAATTYVRDTYERSDERDAFDNGVGSFLFGAFAEDDAPTDYEGYRDD